MTANQMFTSIIVIALTITGALIYTRIKAPKRQFKENYRIDLKQDGYLVYNPANDKITFVKKDSLEEWFLKDNL